MTAVREVCVGRSVNRDRGPRRDASMTVQHWDPERYDRNARFVSDLGRPVVDLLAPAAGERILDLGCGDGVLTAALAAAGAQVIAIDSSPELIAAARARGLDARVMDARALTFEDAFDAVFSNAALHWVRDLRAVVDGVRRSLVAGGRFVGEMGGAGNVAAVCDALTTALASRGLDAAAAFPWAFPTPAAFRGLLEDGGFEVRSIDLFPRPTPIPGAMGGWLETFAEPCLALVAAPERPALVGDVERLLAPRLRAGDGTWSVDYVRLRFEAVWPG